MSKSKKENKKQTTNGQQQTANEVRDTNVNEEAELLKAQLARTLADYDNLKRRTEEEKKSWAKFSSLSIVSKLLPILDILEKAQEHLKDSGLAIALLEFKKVFIEEGLEEVSPKVGEKFDENLMEAIEITKGESDNMISEVVLTGWKFRDLPAQAGGAVVRHAKVKVSRSSS